jgi:hypothetical protein
MDADHFPQELQLHGQQVNTIQDALQLLRGYDKPTAYQLATQLLDKLVDYHDRVEQAISSLYNFVDEEELWKGQEDHAEFKRRWQEARKIQLRHKQNARYIAGVKRKAVTAWGQVEANAFFEHLKSRTMVELASIFVRSGLSYEQMRLAINNEVILRLSATRRGIRTTKGVIQGDLSKALTRKCLNPLVTNDLRAHGLRLDQDGYCCANTSGDDLPTLESTGRISTIEPGTEDDIDMEDEEQANVGDMPTRTVSTSGLLSESSDLSDLSDVPTDFDGFMADEEYQVEDSRLPVAECGCLIKRTAVDRILTLPPDTSIRRKLIALRSICRQLLPELSSVVSESNICEPHAKKIFDLFNMRSASKSHAALAERVDFLYRNMDTWDEMVRSHSTWFRPKNDLQNEPPLGVYRFRHQPALPLVSDFGTNMTWLSFESLYRRILPFPDPTALPPSTLYQQMSDRGSVVIPQLFGWLKEDFDGDHPSGILALIHEEIDMYEYHYQPRPGKPRIGWIRNMWHSLIQQLVRQDPAYYACYVFFRPDHAWRLISFPYYVKSTMPGEQTYFRHIDINLNDLSRTGRGYAVLQGSLSLDDENDHNCTEILPGMHRHLPEWWSEVRERQEVSDGHVQRIEPWMWTSHDALKYGTDWEKEICKAGDVRISLPTLPHGSTGPATQRRRTVLPWFVRIREDHSALDIPESGTWEELSAAHRDLISANRTPSGFTSSQYGHLPYSFPAALRFQGECLISDCLVGRSRWTEPGVSTELDILFGEDEHTAASFIASWRLRAQENYVQLFHEVVRAEKQAFGKDSFFRRKELGLSVVPPSKEDPLAL